MPSERMLRINELLKRELGNACERWVVPQAKALPTITSVKTAPDLRHATVLVSVLGTPEEQQETLRLLLRNRQLFQHEIAEHAQLKYTPKLHFRLDQTLEKAARVFDIIEELHLDEANAAADEPGAAPPEDTPEA